MMNYLRTTQLDILGFTAEYRFLFILTVSLLVVSFIVVHCIRFLVTRKYNVLLGFMMTSGVLSIALLLYEKHMGLMDMYAVWVKTMAAYSLLYAVILFSKGMRKQKT